MERDRATIATTHVYLHWPPSTCCDRMPKASEEKDGEGAESRLLRRRSLSEERAGSWQKETKELEVAAAVAKKEEEQRLQESARSGEYSPSRSKGHVQVGGDSTSSQARSKATHKSPIFKSPLDALTKTVCRSHVYFVCFDAMSTESFEVAKSQVEKLRNAVGLSHRRRASHVGFNGASPEELQFLAENGARRRPPLIMMLGMRWEHVYKNETGDPRASPMRGKTPKTARRTSQHFSSLERKALVVARKHNAILFKVSCAENWVEPPGATKNNKCVVDDARCPKTKCQLTHRTALRRLSPPFPSQQTQH